MTATDPLATTLLLPSFLTGTAEKITNYLLARTPEREKWLRPLNGKVLALSIKPQPSTQSELAKIAIQENTTAKTVPLAYLLFSSQRLDIFSHYQGEVDCHVQLERQLLQQICVGKIPKKQDLSQLLNQQQIILEGDLQLLQQVIALFEAIEKDPAELLSPYFGDVATHLAQRFFQQGRTLIEKNLHQAQCHWGERLTEEWQLLAPRLALVDFADQVEELAEQVEQLEQKIACLSQANNSFLSLK
ncbi:hypothetical protein CEP45_03565 [Mergibacter septicus]|uniref:ubiquinone biosynthesis accessory factor UbiJ n=1 Tax=Mergibacter septicus TaxID=221402 RepID=UPI001C75514F|nr:SCP2 sterol-binding domain-containing protein [Mergibacter septicus]QDJ12981.1 hypothetical protein CEP45_03565 [Mergibacter septicus]